MRSWRRWTWASSCPHPAPASCSLAACQCSQHPQGPRCSRRSASWRRSTKLTGAQVRQAAARRQRRVPRHFLLSLAAAMQGSRGPRLRASRRSRRCSGGLGHLERRLRRRRMAHQLSCQRGRRSQAVLHRMPSLAALRMAPCQQPGCRQPRRRLSARRPPPTQSPRPRRAPSGVPLSRRPGQQCRVAGKEPHRKQRRLQRRPRGPAPRLPLHPRLRHHTLARPQRWRLRARLHLPRRPSSGPAAPRARTTSCWR